MRPARDGFLHFARTAFVTKVAGEVVDLFRLEVLFQKLEHGDLGRREFQLQAEVVAGLGEGINADWVEAAAGLDPLDVKVLGSDGACSHAQSGRRRGEVRNGVQVFGMYGTQEQSESFADALLLAANEVWRPLLEAIRCPRSERVAPSNLTQDGEVVREAAPETVRVSSYVVVVSQVA